MPIPTKIYMKKYIKKNKIKQYGGQNIVQATSNLVQSMVDLGKSIFIEIDSITNISSDINNVSLKTSSIPSVSSPPPLHSPSLNPVSGQPNPVHHSRHHHHHHHPHHSHHHHIPKIHYHHNTPRIHHHHR
jgi:hypothetical protein